MKITRCRPPKYRRDDRKEKEKRKQKKKKLEKKQKNNDGNQNLYYSFYLINGFMLSAFVSHYHFPLIVSLFHFSLFSILLFSLPINKVGCNFNSRHGS